MKGYKAFNRVKGCDKSGMCRGMLFEEGEIYETTGKLKICSNVLHFCEYLVQTFEYYKYDHSKTIYAEVEAIGDLDVEDLFEFKYATNKLKVVKFLTQSEVEAMFSDDKLNTGNQNTGNRNTGNENTGNQNTGDWNTGNRNTGNWNTGNWNTGDWNTSDRNTGFFNTKPISTILVFNVETSVDEWGSCEKPNFIYFNLVGCGDYKKSFIASFNKTTKSDVELLLKLPNFDYKVFEEISGISEQMIMDKLSQ